MSTGKSLRLIMRGPRSIPIPFPHEDPQTTGHIPAQLHLQRARTKGGKEMPKSRMTCENMQISKVNEWVWDRSGSVYFCWSGAPPRAFWFHLVPLAHSLNIMDPVARRDPASSSPCALIMMSKFALIATETTSSDCRSRIPSLHLKETFFDYKNIHIKCILFTS